MKVLAKVFFIIIGGYIGYVLVNSFSAWEVWADPITWIRWGVNLGGLLGLASVAFDKKVFPNHVWRGLLIIMILVYGWQLGGHFYLSRPGGLSENISFLVRYLFLIGPMVVAVTYLAFKGSEKRVDTQTGGGA